LCDRWEQTAAVLREGERRRQAGTPSLDGTVLEPADQPPALPTASRNDRHAAPAARRRHRIPALLQEDPTRLWQPRETAAHFGDVTMAQPDLRDLRKR
jgi:hypothetical protein